MSHQEDAILSKLETIFTKLFEHFQCAICMSDIQNTYISIKCAHRFCEKCIKDCIDNLHKCPLCNAELDSHDFVIRDALFDSLFESFKIFREEKINSLFCKLVGKDSSDNIEFSPLENVMKEHLIKTLLTHQTYTNQLKNNFKVEMTRVDDNTNKKIDALNKFDPTFPQQREDILKKAEFEKAKLQTALDKHMQLIASAYDNYLAKNQMTPYIMPVKVRVRLLCKRQNFGEFTFKPNDDIAGLLKFVCDQTEKTNDKIINLNENDIKIFCFGPLSNYSFDEVEQVFEKYNSGSEEEKNQDDNNFQVFPGKECIPVLEKFIKPNCDLVICGRVTFESDLPKNCYRKTVDRKPVDYFQCKTCEQKWICKNCRDLCHKDHETSLFSANHKPTWSCCYCIKTNCCQYA